MIRCKYAFDLEDECCKFCNGVTMIETTADKKEIEVPCCDCGGYEAIEVEDDKEEVKSVEPETRVNADDLPWNCKNDCEEKDTPSCDCVKCSHSNDTSNTINKSTEEKKCVVRENTQNTVEITAGTGISIEIKGVWYKFDYSEKRTVNPNADINAQKKALWEEVFNQVDSALQDTKESLGV